MAVVNDQLLQGVGVLVATSAFLTGFQSVRLSNEFTALTESADKLEAAIEQRAMAGHAISDADVARVPSTLREHRQELDSGEVVEIVRKINLFAVTASVVIGLMGWMKAGVSIGWGKELEPTAVLLGILISVHILIVRVGWKERRGFLRRADQLTTRSTGRPSERSTFRLTNIVAKAAIDAYGSATPESLRSSDIELLRRRLPTWSSPHLWAAERERRFGIAAESESLLTALANYSEFCDTNTAEDLVRGWRIINGAIGLLWTKPWDLEVSGEKLPPAVDLAFKGANVGGVANESDSPADLTDLQQAIYCALGVPGLSLVYSTTNKDLEPEKALVRRSNWIRPQTRPHALGRMALAHLMAHHAVAIGVDDSLLSENNHAEAAREIISVALSNSAADDSYLVGIEALSALALGDNQGALDLAIEALYRPPLLSNIIGTTPTTTHEEPALVAIAASLRLRKPIDDRVWAVSVQRDPRWIKKERAEERASRQVKENRTQNRTKDQDDLARLLTLRFPASTIRRQIQDGKGTSEDLAAFAEVQALQLHRERILERFWRWEPLVNEPDLANRMPLDESLADDVEAVLSLGV